MSAAAGSRRGPIPAEPRRSLYRAEDVERLTVRKARGRKASTVAETAMSWGEPILASAITTVERRTALLSRRRRGGPGARPRRWRPWPCACGTARTPGLRPRARPAHPPEGLRPARAFAALAYRAGVDPPSFGRAKEALWAEGASLVADLAGALGEGVTPAPLHLMLAEAWGADAAAADLIRRALVLLADHELNASTFAARVAASTGASLAAAALAGLSALSGPHHGGRGRADRRPDGPGRAPGAQGRRARLDGRGEPLPGFGHILYPQGDARGRALLEHSVRLRRFLS